MTVRVLRAKGSGTDKQRFSVDLMSRQESAGFKQNYDFCHFIRRMKMLRCAMSFPSIVGYTSALATRALKEDRALSDSKEGLAQPGLQANAGLDRMHGRRDVTGD